MPTPRIAPLASRHAVTNLLAGYTRTPIGRLDKGSDHRLQTVLTSSASESSMAVHRMSRSGTAS